MFDPESQIWVNMQCMGALPQTTVQFVNVTSTMNEGSGITLDVDISITNPSSLVDTSFLIALDNTSTATNGIDYDNGNPTPGAIVFPQSFTFPAGDSNNLIFNIHITNDDTDIDVDEIIKIKLVSVTGGNNATTGDNQNHTITIIDNETPITSTLLGTDGTGWTPPADTDPWDPNILRDFTNAGYMNGDVQTPDWPVGVNVMDYGATGDGVTDDSQAFIDAIAACPDFQAVYVPNGTYRIGQVINVSKNNFVIRGEDMFNTKLWFPEYLVDVDPSFNSFSPGAFFMYQGGNNRGIENLSFIFKDQQKGPAHWGDTSGFSQDTSNYLGVNPIMFRSGEQDSWMKNIYIKNANFAIRVRGETTTRISLLNIILDNFANRANITDGRVGHYGIAMSGSYCLVHNILLTGVYHHDIAPEGSKNSVFSRISGPNIEIDHHATGNELNLFTEIDTGKGNRGYGESTNNFNETYWHIDADVNKPYLSTSSESIMVAVRTDLPTDIGTNHKHETIDPDGFVPRNIYIAQRQKLGEFLPDDIPLEIPPLDTTSTFDIAAIEDANAKDSSEADNNFGFDSRVTIQKTGSAVPKSRAYIKFDLSDVNLNQPANSIKLRLFRPTANNNISASITLHEVNSDSWQELTLTHNNRPVEGNQIETVDIWQTGVWYEWDVTNFVNNELTGDKIVSFMLYNYNQNNSIGFFSRHEGNPPILRFEP